LKSLTRAVFSDNEVEKAPEEANISRAHEEPVSHLVSNARGSFPQLEMVSVPRPRRHHTYSGPHRPVGGFLFDRASQRVSRKLADASVISIDV
jgi:hypothetical protein